MIAAIGIPGELEAGGTDGDFSLADAEEAAHADNDGIAVLAKHDVIELADRLVDGVGDIGADQLAGAHFTRLKCVELAIGLGRRARLGIRGGGLTKSRKRCEQRALFVDVPVSTDMCVRRATANASSAAIRP